MAGLRLSLAGRRVQECPLPSPAPTSSAFPGQSLLRLGWYAEDGGGAPTLWNKDNGPLSGVTESLFVGVERCPLIICTLKSMDEVYGLLLRDELYTFFSLFSQLSQW